MALNIKSAEAHALARKLADETGLSMTQAVTMALRDALRKVDRRGVPVMEKLMAIAAHCAALPVLDDRSADDIVGYDEAGMPA